jgi:hypothetical protein
MIKKIILSVPIIVALLVLLIPGAAQADGGLTVTGTSVKVNFPSSITFNITAKSDTDITDIRLHYKVERMEHARVVSEVYIAFTPAKTVTIQWVWDMRKTGGIPPGTSVIYWWTMTDDSDKKIETAPETIQIDDGRYQWKNRNEGQITLFWYTGDDAFAATLMDDAQQSLVRLTDYYGIIVDRPVRIYVYANLNDLRGALIFPTGWEGGVEYPTYGVTVVSIATDELEWAARVMPHELTHLVVQQVIFNPYNSLPVWLNEGLAMYMEGTLDPYYAAIFESAAAADGLISVRSMASPFSAFGDEALLAYIESYKLVEYLVDNYGRDKMLELLETFRQGSGYDEALLKVYGFDMDGLNALWLTGIIGATVH